MRISALHLAASAALLLCLDLAACDFSQPGSTPANTNRQYGFGKPTLQVTVNGVHFGPAAPDSGSSASLVNVKDPSTGRIQQSIFRVSASAASVGALCILDAARAGDGVATIGAGPGYIFSLSGSDGTVAPIEGEAVQIPQGTLQCAGSGCNGAGLQLTALDAQHAEGFFSGILVANGGTGDTVCSFYLPMSQYKP